MSNVTPWLLFQSAVDVGGIGAQWVGPEQALDPDVLGEASAGPIGTVFPGQNTTMLRITQPDLGSELPAQFILAGVECEVKGRWLGASTGARTVPVDAVVGGVVRQSIGSCMLSVNLATTCIKGGPTNTLGFSEQDVLLSGFGFRLHGTSSTPSPSGNTLRIDSVRARIHWDYVPAAKRGRGRTRAAVVGGFCV